MPQYKIGVLIDIQDKFSKEITRIQRELKSFEKGFKEQADVFDVWGKRMAVVGAGLGALLIKTGMTAARTEVLGTVIKNLGRVSGISSQVLAEQEEVIKNLGISTSKAREILALFMQGQLDVAQASKIARVAQDLAVIANVNSSDAAQTLTRAIIAQRPILLRQFGIVKDLTDIYKGYAESIGKTADDLTDIEKRQAFLNMILAEGEKVAGTYESAMGDVGKQITSFPRYIEEFENEFGKAFLPVMGKAIKAATDFLKAYQSLPDEMKKFITHATMVGAALGLIVGPLLILIARLPKFSKEIRIALGLIKKFVIGLTRGQIVLGILLIAIGYIIKKLNEFGQEVGSFERAWSLLILQLTIGFLNFAEAVVGGIKKIIGWIPGLEGILGSALSTIRSEVIKTEEEFNNLIEQGL